MATETEMPAISFSGSNKAQDAASRAFEVMRARGMFVSDNAPIRVKRDDLVAFLTASGDFTESDVSEAVTGNPAVFAVETNDDGAEVVITTRLGRAPALDVAAMSHSFISRLMTPEPKPAKPLVPVRERVRVDPSWATFTVPDLVDDEEDEDILAAQSFEEAHAPEVVAEVNADEEFIAAVETPVAPAEPVAPAPAPVAESFPEPEVAPVAEVVEEPAVEIAEPEVTEPELAEVETPTPVVEPVAPIAAPAPVVETVAPVAAPAVSVSRMTDLTGYEDAEIAAALEATLGADAHIAHFGDQWMPEDRVHRLSRGELRRIKEYIDEQEQPLTDDTLVQDVLGVRPNHPNYGLSLFSINYRLSRERDFEFVGTNNQRFWATTTLPSIGTDRRKHNDIGTDYRFLVEGVQEKPAHRAVQSVDHVVTFYEHTLGLLPYDADLQKLMPGPVVPDQRSAVFTFEIPQTYTTYLVELRYPTPNRGGFLLGLDDFYAESVVPGAVISISATENDGHYKVEYLEAEDQEDRLLELDDRRAPRYHFRPTTYSCVVDDKWLISEDRFPKLGSEKPLADKLRRRNEIVIETTFERVGMDDGNGGKLAAFEDLLAAVNIERPFTEAELRAALEADANVSGDDANGYTYAAAA